jgi:hypothetical protein
VDCADLGGVADRMAKSTPPDQRLLMWVFSQIVERLEEIDWMLPTDVQAETVPVIQVEVM